MSQGPLCPNLTKKGQGEVSQMANRNLSRVILLGGLSVNLNHLKTGTLIHSLKLHMKQRLLTPLTSIYGHFLLYKSAYYVHSAIGVFSNVHHLMAR